MCNGKEEPVTKTVHFVTTNAPKVTSVARVLGQYGIAVVQLDREVEEIQHQQCEHVALRKLVAARSAYGKDIPVEDGMMVVDSGLVIPWLGGFPGAYVKDVTQMLGLDGYLRLMAHLSGPQERQCYFEDALQYWGAEEPFPVKFVRRERGHIATERRGERRKEHKSPMAELFVPEGHEKTIAEMTPEEYGAYRRRPETEAFYHEFAAFIAEKGVAWG